MTETEHVKPPDDFVAFPIHNLVAVFHGSASMNSALSELETNGFAAKDIRSFVGQEGMNELDFDGSGHGSLATLLRSLQHIGPDRTYLERYEKYIRDGDCILMVHAPKKDQKQIAADIMRKHSAHRVTYFGALVIEEV
jgi:hypothetical protein